MNKNIKYILILIILSFFFFFFGNGLVSLTNPDEVFYAQTAKEMIRHNSWMTPILFDGPQFEKPIFIYWLLRIAYQVFGVNSFSARFFPAFFALVGVIAVYLFAKLLFKEEKKAFFSGLILLSAGLYIGLARSVFTDMVFSVWILLSLLAFYWGYVNEKRKGAGIILSFAFSAFAVLTKGPLGLFIPLLIVIAFLAMEKRIKFIFCRYSIFGLLVFSVVVLPWYILMIQKYGQAFIHEFFYNDHFRRIIEAEHPKNNTWYFYPMTMAGCMFPWSIFVVASIFYLFRNIKKAASSKYFLICWITVTFLVFQPARSKLIAYIFPMFPALAILCADFIYGCMTDEKRKQQLFILSLLTWFVFLIALIAVSFAALIFSYYLSSETPVYFFILVFGFWLLAILFYLIKNRYNIVFYLFIFFLMIPMAAIPFIYQDIEPYVSSKQACEYLLKNCSLDPQTYILPSKSFVRGVRFYADRKVGVFATNASPFFSPHPIPFLGSDQQAREFFRQHSPAYCLLREPYVRDLTRVADKEFRCQLIKNIGNQYLIRVQKKN